MKILTFDTETFLIQPGRQVPQGVLMGVKFGADSAVEVSHFRFDQQRIRHWLSVMAQPDVLVVGANIFYDFAVLCCAFPAEAPQVVWKMYDESRVWDVLHTEKVIDLHDGQRDFKTGPGGKLIKSTYSLKDIVAYRFGMTMEKDEWRLKYGTFWGTPVSSIPKGAIDYLVSDVEQTDKLVRLQMTEHESKWRNTFAQARGAWWLGLTSAWGFAIDPDRVAELRTRILAEHTELKRLLMGSGLIRGDGTRNKKATTDRLVTACKLRNVPLRYSDTGQVSVDEEACTDSGDALLKKYARYGSIDSMLTSDIRTLSEAAAARMPIQTRFEIVLESGRTSSSGDKKPKKGVKEVEKTAYARNIQNLRREPGVRECYIPRPGHWLISIDWSQMELHTWAQVCKDIVGFSKLGDALNEGIDVHARLGAMLFGRTYEEVVANKKKEQWAKDARQSGKAGNFGLPGGLGAKGIVAYAKSNYGVILTEEEGANLKKKWGVLCPEHIPYFEWVKREIEISGRITQLKSGRVRGGVSFTDAANTMFQGLAADVAKDAGYRLSRAMYFEPNSVLYGSRLVNFVHDEFLFESPISIAHECAFEANRIILATSAHWLPDYPPKAEPALMERWYKDAEAVYEGGRLVPWRPKAAA